MNAAMRIQILVDARQGRAAIAGLQGQLRGLGAAGMAGARGIQQNESALMRHSNSMIKAGKNMQWAGRQLEYRFTLPIVLAGAAATKFALDNEKALTRVRKVYGDVGMSTQMVNREVTALSKVFEVLSNHFGVALSEVNAIAAGWAQAGAQGVTLGKAVRLTMETMILGEMEAEEATKSLIAIMSQFGLSIDQTRDAIAVFNIVENQTAVSMKDLVDVTQRAGGFARVAGVDIRHLAAMTASLVPAAGTAANAGNALKTIFSRILAPTKQAADAMALIGINTNDVGWQSLNTVQKMELLAQKTSGLTTGQKALVDSYIAGRFQVSRFSTLLEDMANKQGRYAKALEVSADPQKNMATMVRELNIVLRSSPQALQIAMTTLKNLMAKIIVPLLPTIIAVANAIVGLVDKFTKLPQSVQNFILLGLAMLALLGPIISQLGAFGLLIGGIGKGIAFAAPKLLAFAGVLGHLAWMFGSVLVGAIGSALGAIAAFVGLPVAVIAAIVAAIAAAIIVFILFRDEIIGAVRSAWDWIVEFVTNLGQLPQAIGQIFIAVVRVIAAAMRQIIEWLSYLNPFARHSPSLVEQVTRGIDIIASKYASLSSLGGVFRNAQAGMEQFKRATAAGTAALELWERTVNRNSVEAFSPGSGDAFDAMVYHIDRLTGAQEAVGREFVAQEQKVALLEAAVNQLDRQLELHNTLLEILQKNEKHWADALDDAKTQLDKLINTPIAGMGAMSDAIFANEMAVKGLQLQVLLLEQAGGSVDDLTSRFAALQGELETLRGDRLDLIREGAGGDVIAAYDAQIAALEAQQLAVNAAIGSFGDLEDQIADLERQGSILDLQQSLQFDPLTRQIDQLTNSMEEMPFDQLYSQIQAQQAAVDLLTIAWEQSNAEVEAQQDVVDALQIRRNAMQATYDNEKELLDQLGEAYDGLGQQIQEMNSALDDFTSKAKSAAAGKEDVMFGYVSPEDELRNAAKLMDQEGKALTDAEKMAESFGAAGAGDMPDIGGGAGTLGRNAGDEFIKEYEKMLKKEFGHFDPLQPIKDAWNTAFDTMSDWFDDHIWGPLFGQGPHWDGTTWDANITEGIFSDFNGSFVSFDWFGTVVDSVGGGVSRAWEWIDDHLDLGSIGDIFKDMFDSDLVQSIKDFAKPIIDEFKKWGPTIKKILEAIGVVIGIAVKFWIEPMIKVIGNGLRLVWRVIEEWIAPILKGLLLPFRIFLEILKPTLAFVGDVIGAALEVIRVVIGIVMSIITGDWEGAWNGMKDLVGAVWNLIQTFIHGALNFIVGLFWAFWESVQLVWEVIHDVIIAAWNTVWEVLLFLWNSFLAWVTPAFELFMAFVSAIWNGILETITNIWNMIWSVIQFVWGAISTFLTNALSLFQAAWNLVWAAVSLVISTTWESIKNVIQGVWNVLSLIFHAIVDFVSGSLSTVWDGFRSASDAAWAGLEKGARTGLKALGWVLEPLRAVISGFASIAEHIPGMGWIGDASSSLDKFVRSLQGMESGGVMGAGGPGFITRGLTAIVGEGRRREYVIPTDPAYRSNAMSLMSQLSAELGLAKGGTIGLGGATLGPKDLGQGVAQMVVNKARDALSFVGVAVSAAVDFAGNVIGSVTDAASSAYDNTLGRLPGLAGGGVLYDRGGVLPPGATLAVNNTGVGEQILPPGTTLESILMDLAADALPVMVSFSEDVNKELADGTEQLKLTWKLSLDKMLETVTEADAMMLDESTNYYQQLNALVFDQTELMNGTVLSGLELMNTNLTFMLGAMNNMWVTQLTLMNQNVLSHWQLLNANTTQQMNLMHFQVATTMSDVFNTMTLGAASAAQSFIDQLNAKIPPLVFTLAAYSNEVKGYGREFLTSIGAPVSFAQGGLSDAHIMRDGAYEVRVSGERGTGGEAYVPRRGASDPFNVLQTAAKWYGYSVIPFQSGGLSLEELFFDPAGGKFRIGNHMDHVHAGTVAGQRWEMIQDFLLGLGIPARPTSTTGGQHVQNSLHYLGRAADYGDSANDVWAVFNALAPLAGGVAIGGGAPLPFANVPAAPDFGPGILAHQGYTMAQIMQLEMQKYLNNVRAWIEASRRRGSGGMAGEHSGPFQDYARKMLFAHGWSDDEWPALYELVRRESSWNPEAVNRDSGAWGLFQFLGKGPMEHDPYVQIDRGLQYIADRYGSPRAALAFHDRNNWYKQGGIYDQLPGLQSGGLVMGDLLAHLGEGGPELVLPLPPHVLNYFIQAMRNLSMIDPRDFGAERWAQAARIALWDVAAGAPGNIAGDIFDQLGDTFAPEANRLKQFIDQLLAGGNLGEWSDRLFYWATFLKDNPAQWQAVIDQFKDTIINHPDFLALIERLTGGGGVQAAPDPMEMMIQGWVDKWQTMPQLANFAERINMWDAYLAMTDDWYEVALQIAATQREHAEFGWLTWEDTRAGDPPETNQSFTFTGNLSFPNMTDPNDIETFINNLTNLTDD